MTARPIPVGKGIILVTSEEFASGYQVGHLTYMTQLPCIPCVDEELTTMFLTRLQDGEYSALYTVGFIVGWLTTLATKGVHPRETPPVQASSAHPTAERKG